MGILIPSMLCLALNNSTVSGNITTFNNSQSNSKYAKNNPPIPMSAYSNYSTILIDGNANFTAQVLAPSSPWTGAGYPNYPFNLSGVLISLSSKAGALITIRDTTVNFVIENDYFQGGSIGIQLQNVTNGVIQNDTITATNSTGLYQGTTTNMIVANNTIYALNYGIDNENCTNSTLLNNIIDGNTVGFNLFNSSNCDFTNNTIQNNLHEGILTNYGENNNFSNNKVSYNGAAGFNIQNTFGNQTVLNNNILL